MAPATGSAVRRARGAAAGRRVRLSCPGLGVAAEVDDPGAPIDPDVRDYRIRLLRTWVRYATAE